MTHPALKAMVEAAKAAYRAGYVNGACCFIGEGEEDLRIGSEQSWNIHQEELLALPNILSLDEYVRGLEEAAAFALSAMDALTAYEADYGDALPGNHELGRIEDSRGSPSFRIRVDHIRRLAAALGGKP